MDLVPKDLETLDNPEDPGSVAELGFSVESGAEGTAGADQEEGEQGQEEVGGVEADGIGGHEKLSGVALDLDPAEPFLTQHKHHAETDARYGAGQRDVGTFPCEEGSHPSGRESERVEQ